MTCNAKIRPFTDDTELTCERPDGSHREHRAIVRDKAWPGSATAFVWQESDRRTFRGDWTPCSTQVVDGCILPAGHWGGHAT